MATPVYLRQLGWLHYNPARDVFFNVASKGLLYASGIGGTSIILYSVFRAHTERKKIRESLAVGKADTVTA